MRAPVIVLMAVALLANAPARRHPPAPVAKTAVKLTAAERFLATNARARGVVQTASGLQYRIVTRGTGEARPTDGDVALVMYVGRLTNGTVFDRSERPVPMPVAGVVPGFAEALKLMRKRAQYRVWIKPSLGYGDKATGPIPAGSVLAFDIAMYDFMSDGQYRLMLQQHESAGSPAPQ